MRVHTRVKKLLAKNLVVELGYCFNFNFSSILSLQSISRDVANNVSHPRRLDPTMELITYSFVLYLQHGRHDVKCKPSILLSNSRKRRIFTEL